MSKNIIPEQFSSEYNRDLVQEYLQFRLNPTSEKLAMNKITESRARKISFNIKKIDSEIKKNFLQYTPDDLTQFFDNINSGKITKTSRVKIKSGNIDILKQNVPYSRTAFYNLKSDFRNFWKFLVYKYDVKDIFLYIK